MTVANATPQQLKELSDYVVMQRAIAGALMRAMAQMNALNNSYNATIAGIIGGPGAGTVIVDASNLAGAVPLTDTQVVNITSYFQSILASYYDAPHQQTLTSACGPGNAL